jgi:hypothetical protein
MGKIVKKNNSRYSTFVISNENEMFRLLKSINGLIKIRLNTFHKSCSDYNIKLKQPQYNIPFNDPYLCGLIDAKGSISYNFTSNRIECSLNLNYSENTKNLSFAKVINEYSPHVHVKRNKLNSRIIFKYQSVEKMIFLYDYFIENKLYSDYKFFRVANIKRFLEVRKGIEKKDDSLDYKIYKEFILY